MIKKVSIKFVRALVIPMVLFGLGILVMSLSSKESVRVRILFDGHPVTAMKCKPKYSKIQSRAFDYPVYSIPSRYGYDSSDESYSLAQFRIRNKSIFRVAVQMVPKAE